MLVTQIFNQQTYEAKVRAHLRAAAFREWQNSLKRGDKLPRGKFFRGKKAGRSFIALDERWRIVE